MTIRICYTYTNLILYMLDSFCLGLCRVYRMSRSTDPTHSTFTHTWSVLMNALNIDMYIRMIAKTKHRTRVELLISTITLVMLFTLHCKQEHMSDGTCDKSSRIQLTLALHSRSQYYTACSSMYSLVPSLSVFAERLGTRLFHVTIKYSSCKLV